jgi:hypothetical protein
MCRASLCSFVLCTSCQQLLQQRLRWLPFTLPFLQDAKAVHAQVAHAKARLP